MSSNTQSLDTGFPPSTKPVCLLRGRVVHYCQMLLGEKIGVKQAVTAHFSKTYRDQSVSMTTGD